MSAGADEAARLIAEEVEALKAMLLAKNAAYGNSALDPVRVFSRADAGEQIRRPTSWATSCCCASTGAWWVRLDDKLSRLARGSGQETEDVAAPAASGPRGVLVRCYASTCCEVYPMNERGCPRCGEVTWRAFP